MRREIQWNNNLNYILNTCKDGNGGTTTNILQQLQSVTEQRVERWNKYQEILDEIGKKCSRRVDVRLARNVYTPSMAGATENAKVHEKPKRCTTGDDGEKQAAAEEKKEVRMTIERCEKCGKSFMRKSEVECHKMWEHPVSPLEERLAAAVDNNNSEDLHRVTSDVMAADCSTSSITVMMTIRQ